MHNKLQAKLLLDSALENLNTHQLSPTPDNYRLWFEYAAGTIEALNTAIDELVSQQQRISQATCGELFQQFVANQDQQDLNEARIALSEMLSVVIEQLRAWDNNSGDYCASLDQCLEQLQGDPSVAEVKSVITTITEQTRQVQRLSGDISAALDTMYTEINTLRADLAQLGGELLTDGLTQCANRRGFDLALKEAVDQACRGNSALALIVSDIDNFKAINDRFGHTVGDKVIKYVASTLRKHLRGNDHLSRFGGEEFTIILPDTDLEGAQQVAENLCQAVSARQLTTGGDSQVIGRVTLSAGVAVLRPGEDPAELFDRADQCMYQAKREGRDRVQAEHSVTHLSRRATDI